MSETVNNGGPAFPVDDLVERDSNGKMTGAPVSSAGMSLRDWFAGQALAGGLAKPHTPDEMIARGFVGAKEMMAEWAYAHADAMLAERAKATGGDHA